MKHFPYFPIILLIAFSCEGPAENPNVLPRLEQMNLRDGITRISDDSLAFVLFAPEKESVYLVGDFNGWKLSEAYKMHKDEDRFWLKIGIPDKNREYICQYVIDKTIYIADPYANKIIDPSGDMTQAAMAVTAKADSYTWKTGAFSVADPRNLVIYEILIRDFTAKRSIKGVQEKIAYLKSLGVNAIELMPFNEFEGSDGWGYNPSFYFAPEKSYGTISDFKSFIDECHAEGIAVIMDMVLNHSYGQSPLVRMYRNADGTVSSDNPWYNVKSNFANKDAQWGYDFNHESVYTQSFVDSVCAYWMKEFRIDGFRFDFTKGFSNTPHPASGNDGWGSLYDAARIKNLKRIYDEIKKRKPDAILICEHLAENREEKELADYGILLWGNLNYSMNEATMGWGEESDGDGLKGDLSWASYRQRDWSQSHLVSYMESHDEERIMFKNEQYGNQSDDCNVKNMATGLRRTEAAAVILLSVPGPKMIWQFGELGYDVSIDYNGRLGKKPLKWEYLDVPERKNLHDVFASMITLHKNDPAFSTNDYAIDLADNFKSVVLKSSDKTVVALVNFDVVPKNKEVRFGKAGTWKEYFTNQTITTSAATENISLAAGEYRLYFSEK
jgi:1,4-alpha-glucan branching enzyme